MTSCFLHVEGAKLRLLIPGLKFSRFVMRLEPQTVSHTLIVRKTERKKEQKEVKERVQHERKRKKEKEKKESKKDREKEIFR